MGVKYTTEPLSGYNSSAPTDDGSATEANKIKWSTTKTKLSDPLKTQVANIDAKLLLMADVDPEAKIATYTTVAGDHQKTMECDGTFTVTLLSVATAPIGYILTIKNSGSGTITIDATSTETIDGSTSTISLAPQKAAILQMTQDKTGYSVIAKNQTASELLTEIKTVDGAGSGLDADLLDGAEGALYARLASPSLTGTPTAPTATAATNNTQLATTAYVDTALVVGFRGCLVTNSALMTINTLSETSLTFNAESYDTDNIHSASSNTDRLTVPSGVSKVELSGYMQYFSDTGGTGYRQLRILKNGAAFDGHPSARKDASTLRAFQATVSSSVVTVIAGDYFTLEVVQDSGGNLSALGNTSGDSYWFSMRIIE